MARFQRILSVPMFLTALGLAWVLGRQTGVDGMALGLGAALLLGLGLWWLGRRQGGGRVWLPLAFIVLAIVAPLPFVRTVEAPLPLTGRPRRRAVQRDAARPASRRRDARLRLFHRRLVPHLQGQRARRAGQAEVAAAFRARGIRVLVGDWTRGDAAIGRFLERHGRSGVPLYLYYAPGRDAETAAADPHCRPADRPALTGP